MSLFLGIEIGGTKLQLAIGAGDTATVRAFWRAEVNALAGAEPIRGQIVEGVERLLSQTGLTRQDISGVGVGFGGPVNTADGRTILSNQVAGWQDFPLVQWIEQTLGWPAALHNDADSAALAEARFGAGQGLDPVMYVTVGSGIGGGLVSRGSIFRGSGAGAMEIGHLRPANPKLRAESSGCSVEEIASGFGLESRARQAIAELEGAGFSPAAENLNRQRYGTLLKLAEGDRSRITARLIARAAAQGDSLSQDLLADATQTFGWALAQAIILINPACIVIGGGVSLMGEDQFFHPIRCACREAVFAPFADQAQIVPARLGEEVVVHGALAVARDALAR
ncbi:MAG: ROK family protein [Planctomycetales bacterium]